jgi:heptose-I-phosphate ethanolaminephosphotransferase
MDLLAKDQSTPAGYLSQIALTANLYLGTEELVKRRRESDVKITSLSNQSNIETVVFVIGESSRPQNWSLYGYNKETTPNLGKQAGLFKFNKICTTAPYTSFAVPSMLSLEPISDWDSIASTKSLVGIYRAAGYMTYWLSVQEVDSFGGIIPQIAAEAQHRQYFERSYDGALISEYEKILNKSGTEKKAIFIHVKGSHFEYSRRYPENFDKFKPLTDSFKDKTTAEYDNSILYTDWLLSSIIDQLKSSKKPSVLVYSSDHGENMMDDSRGLLGHGIGNKYDLPVSAFIWASDNVSSQQSLKLLKLKERESQKVSISSLPHTLLSITGVFTNKYKSSDDLLSDDFVSSKCPYLLGAGYVPSFDFDAL